jgi:hypothetical protein
MTRSSVVIRTDESEGMESVLAKPDRDWQPENVLESRPHGRTVGRSASAGTPAGFATISSRFW